MRKSVHTFLDWWKDAPIYQSIWFIPFVLTLYFYAVLRNMFIGEK